jgi:hypothetical protein
MLCDLEDFKSIWETEEVGIEQESRVHQALALGELLEVGALALLQAFPRTHDSVLVQEYDELETIRNIQLAINRGEMMTHCRRADKETGGNFLIQ